MILHYLNEYVKVNQLTVYFLLTLAALYFFPVQKLKAKVSTRFVLGGILLLGLVLRVMWLGFSAHQPSMVRTDHMIENDLINVHAIELTNGVWFENSDGTPSGRRPIGYPVFLGALYKIFGVHLEVAWAAHLFLYILTGLVLFGIARLVYQNSAKSLAATFLFSIYPISIYSIKLITDEHLFLPVWYLGLFLLLQDILQKPSFRRLMLYSLIFGYATMIRTHTIFMPAVCALAYFLARMPMRQILLKTFLVAILMQVPNISWMIRNYNAWGVPVQYTATASFIYAQVNSTAGVEGGGHIPIKGEPGYSEELAEALASSNEGKMHVLSGREMKKWIVSHPAEFINTGICRILSFMNWNRKSGVWPLWFQYYEGAFDPNRPLKNPLKRFLEESAFALYYIVLYSFLIALILLARQWKKLPDQQQKSLLVILSCFAFWFLEHMIIYPDRKYRFPLEPLMMIIAVFFLSAILGKGAVIFSKAKK
jgi:4-amino-4-deoxy-L-arabinose transferase-like glycosyltransferase